MDYTEINAGVIDQWVSGGWEWGIPITHEVYQEALAGSWHMLLTPTKSVPADWFPDLAGCSVLGLASGGGQQMPLFAARGADCTVLDYSEKQLESERMVAAREGYAINIVRADMTKPLPFENEAFDLIFHPVSNCYVEDVKAIWRECFRVLKPGGLLMAGLDNGINFLFDETDAPEAEGRIQYALPYNPLKDKALYDAALQGGWGIQFSHTLEEQLRGQLQAGFILKDLYEDTNGAGFLHDHGIPTFWASLAVKPEGK